jgi:hypothetical protein
MQKFLHILSEQTQKKKLKILLLKINSKWPYNSRWRPKLNLLVKTTQIIFLQKKNQGCFSCLNTRKIKFSKIQDGTYIQHGGFFLYLFVGALIFASNFKMGKFLHIFNPMTRNVHLNVHLI